MYHSHYLNYMEQARTEWLRHLGFEQHRLYRELGTLFAVTWVEVRFLAPARLDDRLTVSVDLVEQKQASLMLQQSIVRDEGQRPLIDAKVRIAALSSQFKPIRLPAELLQQLPPSMAVQTVI